MFKSKKKKSDLDYIKKVCKIGQGSNCCRYLIAGEMGFECAKLNPDLKALMDTRVKAEINIAKGDNCSGKFLKNDYKIDG